MALIIHVSFQLINDITVNSVLINKVVYLSWYRLTNRLKKELKLKNILVEANTGYKVFLIYILRSKRNGKKLF